MIRKLVAILALSTSLVGCCNQTLPQPKPTPTGAPQQSYLQAKDFG